MNDKLRFKPTSTPLPKPSRLHKLSAEAELELTALLVKGVGVLAAIGLLFWVLSRF